MTAKNILHSFKSFNYRFTLGTVTREKFNNPSLYRTKGMDFVILKSGGLGTKKGTGAFYEESPGALDMYIDDVELETIMTFSTKSNTTTVTNLKFVVVEPYSVVGFIEALQHYATLAGYSNYLQCPLLLKVDFIGYPDSGEFSEPKVADRSTRYVPMQITGIDVEVTASGTKYNCSASTLGDRAYGASNVIKKPVKVTGDTVKDVLTNLMSQVEQQNKSHETNSNSAKTGHDKYEVLFPDYTSSGKLDKTLTNSIAAAKVSDKEMRDNNNYSFPDPANTTASTNYKKSGQTAPTHTELTKDPEKGKLAPGQSSIQFKDGMNIHDCVISIIRDSSFVRDLLKKLKESGVKDDQYVDYYIVRIDTEFLPEVNPLTSQNYIKYSYIVAPYKVLFSRLPIYQTANVNFNKLKAQVVREYDYIYTGKNLDIVDFRLQFNTLFFQGVPHALGANSQPGARNAEKPNNATNVSIKSGGEKATNDSASAPPVRADHQYTGVLPVTGPTGAKIKDDPYYALARSIHDAIVDSPSDMIEGEIKILGDPLYFSTSGNSGYDPDKANQWETVDGELDFWAKEVFVLINFRNPIDYNTTENGGGMKFSTFKKPFGGIYRILSCTSKFSNGEFVQSLKIIRVAGQLETTSTADLTSATVTKPDALEKSVAPVSPADLREERPTSYDLLSQVGSKLPTNGLPGLLSGVVRGNSGLSGLSSSIAETAFGIQSTVNGAVNSVSDAASSVYNVSAIDQLYTSKRLQSIAGDSLSKNVQSIASSVSGVSASAANLIGTARNAVDGLSNATSLGAVASQATNLIGSAQGVVASGLAVVNSINALNPTAITNNLVEQISALPGQVVSNLVNNVGDRVNQVVNGLSSIPASIANQLQGQVSAIMSVIPATSDIVESMNQGVVMDYIAPSDLAFLPSTQGVRIATPPSVDARFFSRIIKEGGPRSAALAFGVNTELKIPGNVSQSITEGLNDLNQLANNATNSIGQAIGSINQTVNSALRPLADGVAAANKVVSAATQITNSVRGAVNVVERDLNAIANITPASLVPNITASVNSKFGSISASVSPLKKLLGN